MTWRSLGRRQALLREAIRGCVRRNVLLVGDLEHFEYGIVDVVRFVQRALRIPARNLAKDVDDTTGVGNVVRRVQNPEALQLVAVSLLEQLIVRAAGNDVRP